MLVINNAVKRYLLLSIGVSLALVLFMPNQAKAVTPISNAVSIDIAQNNGCIIDGNTDVWCWGEPSGNQLGYPIQEMNPYEAVKVPHVTGAVRVSVGSQGACALIANTTVKCWGKNNYGQLGVGDVGSHDFPVQWGTNLTGVADVAVGWDHTCVVLNSGSVKCSGNRSTYGALGDGIDTGHSTIPVDVSNLTNAKSIYAGKSFDSSTCVITTDDRVSCWGGRNSFSRFGFFSNSLQAINTPQPSPDLQGMTSLGGMGEQGNCGIWSGSSIPPDDEPQATSIHTSGEVLCWGRNNFRQLGLADNTSNTIHYNVSPEGLEGITVNRIATGGNNSCALISGAVKCWGTSAVGVIGIGEPTEESYTAQNVIGMESGVTDISVGVGSACSIHGNNGNVSCWGMDRVNGLHNEYSYLPNQINISENPPALPGEVLPDPDPIPDPIPDPPKPPRYDENGAECTLGVPLNQRKTLIKKNVFRFITNCNDITWGQIFWKIKGDDTYYDEAYYSLHTGKETITTRLDNDAYKIVKKRLKAGKKVTITTYLILDNSNAYRKTIIIK